jgi:hypothetical protein
MKNILPKCPKPLLHKLAITALIGIGCFAVGTAYFLFSHDKTTLMLSVAVLVACLLRAFGMYRTISKNAYTVVDGTCIANTANLIRRTRSVVIIDNDGATHNLTLPKATRLKVGQRYRLYLAHGDDAASSQQAAQFLGFEELEALSTEND